MAMKPKVLVTMKLPSGVVEMLEREGMELLHNPFDRDFTRKELLQTVSDVDGVILGAELFDRSVMEVAPRLKGISRFGVGYDNVDVDAATERGIYVTFTPCVLCDTVADLAFGLILCVSRRIPQADAFVRAGRWIESKFPLMVDVSGKTLGIVGLGRIGANVAYRARGFNMRILYHDTVRTDLMIQLERELGVKRVSLNRLLKESDFVTLHVPLNESTRGMIGRREFSLMKKTAYLINTSRGPVVDQSALYEVLRNQTIAGAALDVFVEEPIRSDEPLLQLENVVLTPHIGSATVETRHRMALTAAKDLVRVLKGKEPKNLVNTELLKKKTESKT